MFQRSINKRLKTIYQSLKIL